MTRAPYLVVCWAVCLLACCYGLGTEIGRGDVWWSIGFALAVLLIAGLYDELTREPQ